MADLIMQQVIDNDIPEQEDNKILSVSNMSLNTLYILSDRKIINTKNGKTMIGTLTNFRDHTDNAVVFLPKSLVRRVENIDSDVYIVIMGKVQKGTYNVWDIRVQKIN